MPANPCSSKGRRRLANTCVSTDRCEGSSSGNPLSGVGLAMSSESPGDSTRLVPALELEEEGVGRALAADRGLLTVAGQYDDVVGQGQDLLGQAPQHRRVVP